MFRNEPLERHVGSCRVKRGKVREAAGGIRSKRIPIGVEAKTWGKECVFREPPTAGRKYHTCAERISRDFWRTMPVKWAIGEAPLFGWATKKLNKKKKKKKKKTGKKKKVNEKNICVCVSEKEKDVRAVVGQLRCFCSEPLVNRTVSLACHAVTPVSLRLRAAPRRRHCLLTARNSCDSCSPTIGSILTDTRDQSSANDKVDQHLPLASKARVYTHARAHVSRSYRPGRLRLSRSFLQDRGQHCRKSSEGESRIGKRRGQF